MTLDGAKPYHIILDTRTHSLYLYISASTGQNVMCSINSSKSRSKLVHVLRDKYNEAERPFVPKMYSSVNAYKDMCETHLIEMRPAMLIIKDNVPVYSVYPIFSVKKAPLLTLLLRIRTCFDFLVRQRDILHSIMTNQTYDDQYLVEEMIKRSGHKVIESFAFGFTRQVTIPELIPNAESAIEFQPFEIIDDEAYMIAYSKLDTALRICNILRNYILVELDESIEIPMSIQAYNIVAVTDRDGTLYERLASGRWMMIKDGKYQDVSKPKDPLLLLLHNASHLSDVSAQTITTCGTYSVPDVVEERVIAFRNPLICKMSNMDDASKLPTPYYVQRKLDGNRVIVYSLLGGKIIRYYSKSGYELSSNFNKRFGSEIVKLSSSIAKLLQKPDINLHFDFECYSHGTIHAVIAGLCNSIEMKDGFDKLKLYLLSCFNFDEIHTYEERARKYTASKSTLGEIIEFCQTLNFDEYQTITLNRSHMITSSSSSLRNLMSESINEGYEGLVIYPPNNHYVFGHERLIKLKKVYDGEVRIISYKESDVEPGAIGAVLVESKPFLNIKNLMSNDENITYYVSASLKLEYRSNSMYTDIFKRCIGKMFTIICDSFSETGIPMHARFKAPFHPDNSRHDIDLAAF